MTKPIIVKSVFKFPVNEISNNYKKEIEEAEEHAAETGADIAKKLFMGQYKGLREHQNTEHVKNSFKAAPSKYRGWLYGVFGSGTGNKYGVTVGTRAHFFEYGNSRQPARPYMTPSMPIVSKEFKVNVQDSIEKVSKKENKRFK